DTMTSTSVNALRPCRPGESVRGIEIVIESGLSVSGHVAHRVRPPIDAAPGRDERDFLHVRFEIPDGALTREALAGGSAHAGHCHRLIGIRLQFLELPPV